MASISSTASTSNDDDKSTRNSTEDDNTNDNSSERDPEDDENASNLGLGLDLNPTRDALQEGILGLIRPTLEDLDLRVAETRKAQEQLKKLIDDLNRDLEAIQERQKALSNANLEAAINKLNNSKKKVIVVANILQGAQDRLNKIHQNCLKETAAKRTLLEPSSSTTPSLNL